MSEKKFNLKLVNENDELKIMWEKESSLIIVIAGIILLGIMYGLDGRNFSSIMTVFSFALGLLVVVAISFLLPAEYDTILLTKEEIFFDEYSTTLNNIEKLKTSFVSNSKYGYYELSVITHKKIKVVMGLHTEVEDYETRIYTNNSLKRTKFIQFTIEKWIKEVRSSK